MAENWFSWFVFLAVVIFSLALDLGVRNATPKKPVRHALKWSAFWIGLSLAFNVWVYFSRGSEAALNFFTGYLIEKALSVDNLFVFLMIFNAFQIPHHLRHKILYWGILGAFVMRALFICGGIVVVNLFQPIMYVFGAFLIYTGFHLLKKQTEEIHPERNPIIVRLQRLIPITHSMKSGSFFIKENGKIHATPLFLALIAVETSDLIFAIDSIPAIFGITTDPYIVLTSNIFAILGLRSLYFALEGMIDLFHHLHYGLAAALIFIGLKMVLEDWIHIPIAYSLGFIFLALSASIIASLIDKKPKGKPSN